MQSLACVLVLSVCSFAAAGSLAASASAQAPVAPATLQLTDLVNRPERWPAKVTLTRDYSFGGGKGAKAGQAVQVLEFNGAQVTVDAGNELVFDLPPAECDLLSAANAAWAPLTPAQRAVDKAGLLQDASLWPERVKCSSGFRFEDGTVIPAGGEFELMTFDQEGVKLYAREAQTTLLAELPQTDLVARARERALLELDKRPSRIAAVLKDLVDASGKPATGATVADAKVYALYFGASWCGPCRKFSPGFVQYVNGVSKDNPHLATVLLSNDKQNADMLEYMQDEKMPWPALPLEKLMNSPLLLSYAGGSIPHLVILDRHGKVLASSIENGGYVGVEKPFGVLKKLVASGAAK
ncbi:MAG: hypothetical protein EXS08_14415 [Planctomycetes bacterium]|nr:hypothetical protein [Planctomycetota bacterium]